MRTFLIILIIAASVSRIAAGELKIATVDAQRLLKLHPEAGRIARRMEQLAEDYTAEGQRMVADHRRLKREFEASRTAALSAVLTSTGRDKRMIEAEDKLLELMESESRIRDSALGRRRQLDDEHQRMRQHIVGKIKALIRDYARENGLSIVLDSSGQTTSEFEPLIYAPDTMDITAAIEARMRTVVPQGKDVK